MAIPTTIEKYALKYRATNRIAAAPAAAIVADTVETETEEVVADIAEVVMAEAETEMAEAVADTEEAVMAEATVAAEKKAATVARTKNVKVAKSAEEATSHSL